MSNESLKHTIEMYQKLVEIARDLASTLEIGALLHRIVDVAADLCNAEAASILLYDQKHKELTFQASTDITNAVQMGGIVVPKESIAGWVAMQREPVIVEDVHRDQRFFKDVEKILDFPTHSILAVPMIVKEQLVGVLEAINCRQGSFTAEDQVILQVLAGQAGVAIENTRLFHQSDAISELVHELRTPLTSIQTLAYLLQQPALGDTRRVEMARSIQGEVHRLTELTNNFLDLSRLESGRATFRLSRFDLPALLEQALEVMGPRANERNVSLVLDVQPGLPELEADRGQIQQVILNLLSNAVKYNLPQGKVTVQVWAEGPSLFMGFQDTGIGIPEESIGHLFERFYRVPGVDSPEPGTGLGLLISKQIIEAHGGKISVQSHPGDGTRFTISLPLRQTKA